MLAPYPLLCKDCGEWIVVLTIGGVWRDDRVKFCSRAVKSSADRAWLPS
jgi:hypothetical protein